MYTVKPLQSRCRLNGHEHRSITRIPETYNWSHEGAMIYILMERVKGGTYFNHVKIHSIDRLDIDHSIVGAVRHSRRSRFLQMSLWVPIDSTYLWVALSQIAVPTKLFRQPWSWNDESSASCSTNTQETQSVSIPNSYIFAIAIFLNTIPWFQRTALYTSSTLACQASILESLKHMRSFINLTLSLQGNLERVF